MVTLISSSDGRKSNIKLRNHSLSTKSGQLREIRLQSALRNKLSRRSCDVRLEANTKSVIRNSGICVDISENGQNTGCLRIGPTGIVIVDVEDGVRSGVFQSGGECSMDERKIGYESGA